MLNVRNRITHSLILLAFVSACLPDTPTTASAAEECLRIEGSTSISIPNPTTYENKQLAEKEQTMQLNYQLTPLGFRPADRAPVDVMLDLDTSSSMYSNFDGSAPRAGVKNRMAVLQENASALVEKFREVNLNDQVGLVIFNNSAELKQPLTADYTLLNSVIGRLGPGGNTNIAEALRISREALARGANAKKYIVLITDGDANYPWPTGKQSARSEADLTANGNITIFTVAMGDGNAKVGDLSLLNYISGKTQGTTYTATDREQLANVFKSIANEIKATNRLSGITITQQLPVGFELVDNTNPKVQKSGNTLTITVDNIPYPFGVNTIPISVPIKQTSSAGHYIFEKPTISYTNACLAPANAVIHSQAEVSVLVKVRDRYGNIYYGDASGKVTRHSADTNDIQWHITEKSSPVSSINFRDADPFDAQMDDSVVSAGYQNSEKSEWDLTPTRPILVIKDAGQEVILDQSWHRGEGTFEISGSGNRLPESTVYGIDSFKAGKYISGYEYAINGGDWKPYRAGIKIGDGINGINGPNNLHVRALTKAIGSITKPALVHGEESNQSVNLDRTPPSVSVSQTSEAPTDDGTISIAIEEDVSPIISYSVKLDGKDILKESENIGKNKSIHFSLSEKIREKDARIGWHQIEVTARSVGGQTNVIKEPFLVNPGPKGTLEAVNYTSGESDKPVKVKMTYEHPVKNKAYGKDAPTITNVKYAIIDSIDPAEEPTEADWKELNGKQFILTQNGRQTNYFVHFKLVDSEGVPFEIHRLIQINYNQKRY